jgi:hypothetical protein
MDVIEGPQQALDRRKDKMATCHFAQFQISNLDVRRMSNWLQPARKALPTTIGQRTIYNTSNEQTTLPLRLGLHEIAVDGTAFFWLLKREENGLCRNWDVVHIARLLASATVPLGR